MSFTSPHKRFLNLVIVSMLVVSCAEASAAEAPIALAPVGVTINTNTPPPTARVSPTLRPPTQPPTHTLVPTLRPTNTLAPIGRPPVRPAVQAVAPTLTFTSAPQVARSGTIREIEVESDVLSKLNSNAVEGLASLGQKITSGGTVRTLDRGKARIDLNEGTVVRIAPKTMFTVTDLNQDTLNPFTRLSLTFGKIFIVLTGGRMEVETPIGSASVRGSFMSVEFNAALRQLTVNCLETAFNCDLSFQGTIFNLITLQKMIVPPYPPTIQPMTGADIKDWLINVPNSSNVIAPTNTPPPPPAPATGNTATNIVVNTLTDELNSDGDCSLREAIRAANTNLQVDQCVPAGGSDTITFSVSGIIPMMGTIADRDENAALIGDYDITESLTIIGNGAANTTISGNNVDRVFHIWAGTVSLSEMTISNGNPGAAASGGGVLVGGGAVALSNVTVLSNAALRGGGVYMTTSSLTISGSTIKSNTATGDGGGIYADTGSTLTIYSGLIGGSSATDKNTAANGGGIYAKGTTTISNGAVIQKNETTVHGGGIYNLGTLSITGSTLSSNIADSDGNGSGNGGGLWNNSTATLTTSTVSSNSAQDGGGITNDSTLTLDRTTLSSNNAKNNGGGLINVNTITITNSTISGNTANSDNTGSGDGGGIAHDSTLSGGTANLSFVTITNNNKLGTAGVGGLKHVTAVTVKNSIIADQAGSNSNCGGAGTLTASGNNYASDATCTSFTNSGAGVLISTTLAGGPPAYHLLAGSSPAQDVISAANCTTIAGGSASPAQNGQARPTNTNCDAGAVEMP